jgi:secreted trypsin-like serine protease
VRRWLASVLKSDGIVSGASSEAGFGLTGRLQEVRINLIDCETCSDLYDGDIVDSVIFYAGVPGGGEDSCQVDAGGPFSIGLMRSLSKTAHVAEGANTLKTTDMHGDEICCQYGTGELYIP